MNEKELQTVANFKETVLLQKKRMKSYLVTFIDRLISEKLSNHDSKLFNIIRVVIKEYQ